MTGTALLVLGALGAALPAGTAAAPVDAAPLATEAALQGRALAAACASCHGREGRALPGARLPGLAGRPAAALLAQLDALRDGRQPALLMPQILRGYTPQQLAAIAAWFAQLPPPTPADDSASHDASTHGADR
jgi:cytochrome c553